MRLLLLLLVLLPNFALGAQSNIFTSRRDTVSLVAASNVAVNGKVQLALQFKLAPGWHIYWQNPGDAGLPPQIILDAPAAAGPFSYPPPEFLLQDGVAAYVLSRTVILPFNATGVGAGVGATARWLVCSNICIPEHARFVLTLAAGPALAGDFAAAPIIASPFAARVAPDGTLSLAGATAQDIRSARFFPYTPGALINAAPQPLRFSASGMILELQPGPNFARPLAGILELTDPSGVTQALDVSAAPGPAATPLAVWLGFAFLGGVLLNLMPCVFPVLAMKVFGLIRLGGASRRAVWREATGYTAGILAAMLMLAAVLLGLRALGGAEAWGFQFQSPVFLAVLAWLIFGAGLSLAGAFTLSLNFGRLRPSGSFFNGLLAVAVATPCTAPFMAGAIAAALAAPLPAAFGIFLLLGLGLAAPFLLVAAIPASARLLPRPGAWMVVLQRLLSLPMFATALWLAWVMWHEAGLAGLVLLVLGALVLAIALSWRGLRPLGIAALLPLLLLRPAAGAPLTVPGATAFTPARLAALRAAHQPILVDITAAWCLTCLVNERTALDIPATRAALARTHTRLLVGDWTNRNATLTAYLAANGRAGVPLYAFYPPTGTPRILPQILTPGIVANALTAPAATARTPPPGD